MEPKDREALWWGRKQGVKLRNTGLKIDKSDDFQVWKEYYLKWREELLDLLEREPETTEMYYYIETLGEVPGAEITQQEAASFVGPSEWRRERKLLLACFSEELRRLEAWLSKDLR